MAMRRTTVNGEVLNKRTADMLKRAEQRLGYDLNVVQGSYNQGGVSASAGTHDGGGAVDISVRNLTNKQKKAAVHTLREVGFAAWYRDSSQGPWSDHIHAIAIGDPEMSAGAASQVRAYFAGLNGLASQGPDDGPKFDPIPQWPIILKSVSAARIANQFKAENPRKVAGVRRVQRLLNRRLDLNLIEDGVAGPKTKAAWKQWEKYIKSEKQDGIPGPGELSRLLAGFYRVGK